MSNTIYLVVFPLVFLAISTLIFSGNIDDSGIPAEMEKIGCPMPSSSGLWNSSGTIMYSNGTYNYEAVGVPVNTLTCSNVHTLDGYDYFYGAPTVPFAGFPLFLGDWLSVAVEKAGAMFAIVGVYLNATIPVNLITEAPVLAIPYGFIFLMEGYGLYMAIHPLKR